MLKIIDALYPSAADKLAIMYIIVVTRIRQWFQKSVHKIGEDTYQLTHVIDGQLVKINLKRVTPKIVDVLDSETDESHIRAAKPFLLFKQTPFHFERKATFIYEDGQISSSE
ncbi:MAG: hypothetical protein ACRCTP_22860 [Aeromonas popoffii]|uniref:hypothetical protein n=1 Tax=Aeromonas popoffii TaxID=70856 RepID=UPI003F3C3B25